MSIKYESCPYCYSKNVVETEHQGIVTVQCLDCTCRIDTYSKENP